MLSGGHVDGRQMRRVLVSPRPTCCAGGGAPPRSACSPGWLRRRRPASRRRGSAGATGWPRGRTHSGWEGSSTTWSGTPACCCGCPWWSTTPDSPAATGSWSPPGTTTPSRGGEQRWTHRSATPRQWEGMTSTPASLSELRKTILFGASRIVLWWKVVGEVVLCVEEDRLVECAA
jgi:hypothetical protein